MTSQSSRVAWLLAALLGALLAVTSALGLAACNEQSPPPPAARFDRPNRVAFLCARDAEVLPLETCGDVVPEKGDPIALHALVTQAGRGEIAAVNLRRRRVIDTRREIPGFTYQPVGEAPAAVVVPAKHPMHTYVASFGGRDLRVVRTRTLIAPVDEEPLAQTVALALPETGERVSPTSMVITPDESALIVGVPDVGKLLLLPIVRCAAGAADCEDGLIDESGMRSIDLGGSVGRIAELEAIEPSHYQRLCGYDRTDLPRATSPVVAASALTATPRPSALTVDPYCPPDGDCAPRILVADDALPLLHVLDIAALLAGDDPLRAPLVTGVPTSALAVTPYVPREVNDESGGTQYVYAVDATDGSVLVLERGFVLEVNDDPTLRPDRISLGAGRSAARALTVITPTFDTEGPPQQYVMPGTAPENYLSNRMCRDEQHDIEEPARLRGVFLAVATTEGFVDIVDIHDMELLPDTSGDDACRACSADSDAPVVVRNHRRLLTTFTEEKGETTPEFIPELRQLRFQIEDLAYQVRTDGTTASPAAPGLNCIECGEGRVRVYPTLDPDEISGIPSDAGVPDGGVRDGGLDAGAADAALPGMPAPTPAPQPATMLDPEGNPTTFDGGFDAAVPDEDVVVHTCPAATALVCASNDPWSTPEELYTAIYEGRLPGTGSVLGGFVPPEDVANRTGGLELMADLDPCTVGVLGEEDMAPDYAGCKEKDIPTGGALNGDQVVVISQPLGAAAVAAKLRGRADAERVAERCQELGDALVAGEGDVHVAFEIRRAYRDRLVLQTALVAAVGKVHAYDQLADCYQSPISVEVRSYRAFTVTGAGTGFAHRVRANAAGRCQIDDSLDPLLRGRARIGCRFENHSIELQLGANDRTREDAERRPPLSGTRFEVFVASRARKLILDARQVGYSPAAVVATDLAWNPIDERLYLVDISDRGLLPIPVDPFPPALSTRYQYR